MSWDQIAQIINFTLRNATPVILAALGGLLTEHAGIMNIGMEGMMLSGCFFAVAFSYICASSGAGVIAAILVGIILGLFFALFVVKLKADEFIIGMTLNTFAGGLTAFLLRSVFGKTGSWASTDIIQLPKFDIPLLSSIPYLGKVFENISVFVAVSWILIVIVWIFLYKTPYGFWMRASGEHPEALETAGISPIKMKFIASVACGILCGIAGAHLSLGYVNNFAEGMSASRGFIAFACVVFGMSNPPKVYVAALMFGFLQAISLNLQEYIASDLTAAIPYLVTIIMLIYVTVSAANRKKRREKQSLKEQSGASEAPVSA
ncbi:MAG: ABC transporter permease [Clostridia bacterium]|nr:ABC transporter permease [Clostridia bacterium]